MIQVWVATGMTVLTCLVSIVINFTVMRVRVDDVSKREVELKNDLAQATRELNNAINIIKTLSAEQAVINKFVTDMLNGLNIKLELHTSILTDHTVSIGILKELRDSMKRGAA